jgi:hypothetical protein
MMRKVPVFLLASIIALGTVGSQVPDTRLAFAWVGIEYQGSGLFSETEMQLLNNRLNSYLLEIARQEDYSLTAPRDAEDLRRLVLSSPEDYRSYLATKRRLTSQGIITLRLSRSENFYLEAFIMDPSSGEVLFSLNQNFGDFDGLVDDSRGLVYALFGLSPPVQGAIVQVSPSFGQNVGRLSNVTMVDLVGRWQGDFDLGEVQINADGSALAKLANNEQLRLQVQIQDQRVIISQDEPNSPKLYLGSFPLSIATQITRVARPMSWEFSLGNRKDQLTGKKNTSAFSIEKGRIIQTDNSYSREAVWTRIP